ncbi:DUF1444 domain-containing protein [Mangrovibacillus cuniculi]|uniref:UPF0354 protein G8O30_09915 n=1 Tax=Mangrovibacillus cuniculi TaxID=2593652 RepID=A0A7S8CC55_9BACI|nr:DUF1444 domain-containing protein [Mangrovibacillus cuniculi]QPC47265.1 DUF1444 domain-containing protein [Mangrovibacillus cuniculi]
MKMTSELMKTTLTNRLQKEERSITYNKKEDQLRIEDTKTGKGVTLSIPNMIVKWERTKEKAFDEIVYYVEEALHAMTDQQGLNGQEQNIFPVIRSTSFPNESERGSAFIVSEHTAETRVYYSVDLGTTYRLIDQAFLEKEGWTEEQVKEVARFNVKKLSTPLKKDTVAGNHFYFLATKDGYDASRILNERFLEEFSESVTGKMAVAVPHQDVLILADIQNETGYDILAQLTMSFFSNGHVPITALSFLYESSELEPIFILGKNRRVEKE